MPIWLAFIDLIRTLLPSLSHVASVASLAVLLAPTVSGFASNRMNALMMGAITIVIAWRLASGVGLYWVGSNVVGVAQSLILRRIVRRVK